MGNGTLPRQARTAPPAGTSDAPRATGEAARATGETPRATGETPRATGEAPQAERGKTMRLLRTARGDVIRVEVADSFLRRFCGLMLRRALPADGGLLLAPCASIHMCFMRFAIDAVYLDDDCRILKIAPHLLPWLGLSCCRGAWGCLELPAGAAARLGLAVGERLSADA